MTSNRDLMQKLNEQMAATFNAWLDGQSKEELLSFIASCDAVDADALRTMLRQTNAVFVATLSLDMGKKAANVDFNE